MNIFLLTALTIILILLLSDYNLAALLLASSTLCTAFVLTLLNR